MISSIINRSHEWLKHGTCSDMQTENEYFSTVLKIFESGLNFGDILEKGGIQPSSTDTYKVITSVWHSCHVHAGVFQNTPSCTPPFKLCLFTDTIPCVLKFYALFWLEL